MATPFLLIHNLCCVLQFITGFYLYILSHLSFLFHQFVAYHRCLRQSITRCNLILSSGLSHLKLTIAAELATTIASRPNVRWIAQLLRSRSLRSNPALNFKGVKQQTQLDHHGQNPKFRGLVISQSKGFSAAWSHFGRLKLFPKFVRQCTDQQRTPKLKFSSP